MLALLKIYRWVHLEGLTSYPKRAKIFKKHSCMSSIDTTTLSEHAHFDYIVVNLLRPIIIVIHKECHKHEGIKCTFNLRTP